MSPNDLNFFADALLSLCDRDSERPHYSDRVFKHKLRLAGAREPVHAHLMLPNEHEPLLRRECDEVFARAQLTERQTDVLMQRLDGWTFEEIGKWSGHSKQGAQHIFAQALRKLARAFYCYPFRGLSDVYWWETHRGVRRTCSGRLPVNVVR